MAKSVNDYYADKMKKLLENQKPTDATPKIVAPSKQNSDPNHDRQYYDRFRENIKKNKEQQAQETPKPKATTQKNQEKQARPQQETAKPKKESPEQTAEDLHREEQRKQRAVELAQRARRRRKIRDGILSGVLIFAVTALIAFVAYRLLFVVRTVTVEGDHPHYTDEQLIEAADVMDVHLFSFRESVAEQNVILSCPLVESVDVIRTMPSTITLKIVEESPKFYCNIYGETYGITKSVRVVDQIEDTTGLAKIVLPSIKSVLIGEHPEFANLKSDSYIYDIADILFDTDIGDRITYLNLTDRFDIKVAIDNQYLLSFGNMDSIETKVKIAVSVLEDDMFKGNTKKYRIDLTDMSETSVIQDDNLDFDKIDN